MLKESEKIALEKTAMAVGIMQLAAERAAAGGMDAVHANLAARAGVIDAMVRELLDLVAEDESLPEGERSRGPWRELAFVALLIRVSEACSESDADYRLLAAAGSTGPVRLETPVFD